MKSHSRIHEEIYIIMMLATCSFKWIFEGRFSLAFLEAGLLTIALLPILKNSVRINFGILMWILVVAYICISMALRGTNPGNIIKLTVFLLTVMYLVFADFSRINMDKVFYFIEKTGLFYSFFVYIHFILKERFNALYFPLLSTYNQHYAYEYYRGGRYFGLLYAPHEVAGILVFSIILVILRIFANSKTKMKDVILLFTFLFALILTGKRGVLVAGVVSIFITILCFYNSRKMVVNSIKVIVVFCILGAVFIYLVNRFPDSLVFYRINRLYVRLLQGDVIDKVRRALYKLALITWQKNKILGIGWRNFIFLTTNNAHFSEAHQVNCDYLQWLCEMGLTGFTICILAVMTNLKYTLRLCKNLNKIHNSAKKKTALFGIAVQLFIVMYAVCETPFYDILFFAFYILSCIIVIGMQRELRAKGTINE